jgi:hypothetical protein
MNTSSQNREGVKVPAIKGAERNQLIPFQIKVKIVQTVGQPEQEIGKPWTL